MKITREKKEMKSSFFPLILTYGTINMKNSYKDKGFNAN